MSDRKDREFRFRNENTTFSLRNLKSQILRLMFLIQKRLILNTIKLKTTMEPKL